MRVHRNYVSSTERYRAGALWFGRVALTAAVLLAPGACTQRTAATRDEAGPSTSTSATFQLAPSTASSTAHASIAAPDAPAGAGGAASAPGNAQTPGVGVGGHGSAFPGCVRGWATPERGSPLRGAVLDMMRVRPGERFVVEEMRYFVGPEDAEVLGARGEVERWYVRASTETEPRRRQRWLVRRSTAGSGVDAIAPFDSTGYGPGIWRRPDAPDESFADPFERPCQGAKSAAKCTGLPREVLGCLAGT